MRVTNMLLFRQSPYLMADPSVNPTSANSSPSEKARVPPQMDRSNAPNPPRPSGTAPHGANVRPVSTAKSGNAGMIAAVLGIGAVVGAYYYFRDTRSGQKAMVDVKAEIEKKKIDAKHEAHNLMDKAKDSAMHQVDHLKDKAKDAADTVMDKAKEGLDKAKKSL